VGELTESVQRATYGGAIVEVEHLVKRYRKGKANAVDGISFSVRRGEFFAFLGPNGAGKTTTLRAIAGIIAPTRGRISIAGHELATQPVEAKRRLAFIPDEPQLFEYLTVEEHLRFVGRMYGVADAPARIPPRPAPRTQPCPRWRPRRAAPRRCGCGAGDLDA